MIGPLEDIGGNVYAWLADMARETDELERCVEWEKDTTKNQEEG